MERAPAFLGVGRRLAAHDAHRRVEGEQARAGHERQVLEIEDETARAVRVGVARDVDDLLVVRRVELAGEGDDRHRRGPAETLDVDRHRHRSVLLASTVDRAHQGELVASIGSG